MSRRDVLSDVLSTRRFVSAIILVCVGLLTTRFATAADDADALATPQTLIEMVSDAKRFPSYDAQRLQRLVEQFNQAQIRRYKVDAEQMIGLPQGFASAQFEESGPYFALKFQQVETTHTDDIGVDGGADKYFAAFWSKQDRTQAVIVEGLTYAFADPRLQLAVPTRSDCAGNTPTGRLEVQDLSTGNVWFSTELHDGTMSVSDVASAAADEISFEVYTEAAIDTSSDEHQCEVGDWVKKTTVPYTLRCNPKTARCTTKKGRAQVSEGCTSMAACD